MLKHFPKVDAAVAAFFGQSLLGHVDSLQMCLASLCLLATGQDSTSSNGTKRERLEDAMGAQDLVLGFARNPSSFACGAEAVGARLSDGPQHEGLGHVVTLLSSEPRFVEEVRAWPPPTAFCGEG